MKNVIKFIASVFYVGYSPVVPGTNGALVGLIFYLFTLRSHLSFLILTAAVTVVGFLVSGRAEEIFGKKDAKQIVIDETAGMMLSFALIPYKMHYLVIGFILFRILDIIKPYPARSAENLHGSAGIMLDDIICAVYTNIALRIIIALGF